MKYSIECKDVLSKYLQIQIEVQNINKKTLKLQLPAWRPGRYQIQNFAKNIRNFSVMDPNGSTIPFKKTSKDLWKIESQNSTSVTISYEYYANQQDAGGSYVDKQMLYVNPINLLMYVPGNESHSCSLHIKYSKNKSIACGLSHVKMGEMVVLNADSYHDLVDSPLILSDTLKHIQYEVNKTHFHFWIQGKVEYPQDIITKDFKAFTKTQIEIFGEFPEQDYHYLLWVPPHPYYHGVEHFNSTMMVLGPDSQEFEEMYPDLLGLASHELFHTWNIKKIRPKELLPYKYDRENYFTTCFIAEGFTTFYGDWMLYRSNVIDKSTFQKELETTLKRHFDFADESTLSLLESSYDLWLDGYESGAPNRKVSVYHKGAVATILLNHQLKQHLNHPYPMDIVMREMWKKFGKTGVGYTYSNFKNLILKLAKDPMKEYFESVIEGNKSLFAQTQSAIDDLGFSLKRNADGRIIVLEKN